MVSIDRVTPTQRPAGPPVGSQRWRDLLFVHWEVPLPALRRLVPEPLAIDTFDGRAYVGLVPFTMRDVRPLRALPSVPTARDFHEVNLRTYVHLEGQDPGVWFFSLDAASTLAVLGARAGFHLPYWRGRIDRRDHEGGARSDYRLARLWPGDARATLDVSWERGAPLGPAKVGTFEHFLVERYILYAAAPRGRLFRAQVHHPPYGLHGARVTQLRESLVHAAGIEGRGEPIVSELWSEGVDVDIFPLERVR